MKRRIWTVCAYKTWSNFRSAFCDQCDHYYVRTAKPKCVQRRPNYSLETKGTSRSSPLIRRSFLSIAILATYMRVTYLYMCLCAVCLCVCDQERELLMRPAPPIRGSAPVRNIGTTKSTRQYAQIRLPSRLRILFLVLLVSILPHSSSGGAWTCALSNLPHII